MGNRQTEAQKRYNAKQGIVSKSYKIKKDVADRFAEACKANGEGVASTITRLMEEYIANTKGRS